MPSQWSPSADRDLLLSIIDEGKLQSLDWHAVAAKMRSKGYTFTHEACRQHFQKLRRASTTGTTSSNPTTPKTPTSRKSKKFTSNLDNDDDEEPGDFATPSKKRKRVPKINAEAIVDLDADVDVDVDRKDEIVDLGGFEGQTATRFKMESLGDGGEVVDLEGE